MQSGTETEPLRIASCAAARVGELVSPPLSRPAEDGGIPVLLVGENPLPHQPIAHNGDFSLLDFDGFYLVEIDEGAVASGHGELNRANQQTEDERQCFHGVDSATTTTQSVFKPLVTRLDRSVGRILGRNWKPSSGETQAGGAAWDSRPSVSARS